jgi:hypothetical protein
LDSCQRGQESGGDGAVALSSLELKKPRYNLRSSRR